MENRKVGCGNIFSFPSCLSTLAVRRILPLIRFAKQVFKDLIYSLHTFDYQRALVSLMESF